MYRKILIQAICLIQIFILAGCSGDGPYRLKLYSRPTGALVQIGSKSYGQTPCNVTIPRDSHLIEDNQIDVTYSYEDGRSYNKTYDLRDYKPKSDIPNSITGAITGTGLVMLSMTQTQEDDKYSSIDKEDSTEQEKEIQLIGAGLVGIGLLLGGLFDVDLPNERHSIMEHFDEAAGD